MKEYCRSHLFFLHVQHWNPGEEATVYFDILNAFSKRVKTINETRTEQDHDLYEIFTKEVFNHEKYTQHKISKHLSSSKEYVPDYKLAYMYEEKQTKDLFIIEIKKKEKLFTPNDSDKIKINLEMQVMLNDLIKQNDEIRNFIDAKYVSAPEACWRLFSFSLHKETPPHQRLAIHLPGENPVYFFEYDNYEDVLRRSSSLETTLTGWFKMNETDPNARTILYPKSTYGMQK